MKPFIRRVFVGFLLLSLVGVLSVVFASSASSSKKCPAAPLKVLGGQVTFSQNQNATGSYPFELLSGSFENVRKYINGGCGARIVLSVDTASASYNCKVTQAGDDFVCRYGAAEESKAPDLSGEPFVKDPSIRVGEGMGGLYLTADAKVPNMTSYTQFLPAPFPSFEKGGVGNVSIFVTR